MNSLCEGALTVLGSVYSEETGLFPFTSRVDGNGYKSVFDHPRTIRSTINCLLGLQGAARHRPEHELLARSGEMTRRFLRLHEQDVDDAGDLGLLTALLAEGDDQDDALTRTLGRIGAIAAADGQLRRLNVQDLSWLVWGAVSSGRRGLVGAEPVARRLFGALSGRFVRPGEVLARHALDPGRGAIVSFGASVYFLRSAYSFGTQYGSSTALDMFRSGASALLSAQGPQGEWPWLISCRDGRPLDYYPVFSVHQHSMCLLFLHVAHQDGMPGTTEAIDRSMSWVAGENQLGRPMVQDDPFFIYRSIERKARQSRPQRFLRARWMLHSGRRAGLVANEQVAVNTECRSYELGWILYTLSGD